MMADEENDEDTIKTRTYVDEDGNTVLWHKGDSISYNANNTLNAKYVFNGDDGASSAEFTKVENTGSGTYGYQIPFSVGIYPYDKLNDVKYSSSNPQYEGEPYCSIYTTYPATQTYAPN